MLGPIALAGSGEFTPAMEAVDGALLAATGRRRPRVAILPTASWPDGPDVFEGWATKGVAHFSGLGAEVEPILLRDRAGADDPAVIAALGEADLVYLSGGKPAHLLEALSGTPAEAAIRSAHERGAIIVGCSAGAMVLGAVQMRLHRRWRLRVPVGWGPCLGLVPGVAVLPHYDAFPEPLSAVLALAAPPGVQVLGIDEQTVLVGCDGSWQVHGPGRVTVWRGRHRTRHRDGEVIAL
jgi:cyanophycinase